MYALARSFLPSTVPSLLPLIDDPRAYVLSAPGEALVSVGVLLLLAVGFAALLAARVWPFGWVARRFAPSIVDASAWYHVFESGPDGHYVYVGCRLGGGQYVGGVLDWYSTDVKESNDRGISIAHPLTWVEDGNCIELGDVERIVLSAGDIDVLSVSFIKELT